MTRCANNIRFDASASVVVPQTMPLPVEPLYKDATDTGYQDYRLDEISKPNNPVLTRTSGFSRRFLPESAAATGAFLATMMSSFGCTGQGDVAIASIALGWGLATVGAWGGILLGLDRLAGWLERRRVAPDVMQQRIDGSDWQLIENALLDEDRIPPDIASMQLAVLASPEKIPMHWQPRIYKAIAVANGDPQLAARALHHLLGTSAPAGRVLIALERIIQSLERKPNKYVGIYAAKALIRFEWAHNREVPDSMLARAVALTNEWLDTVILIGILATRIKLGYTQTNAHLFSAIRYLLQKPFGFDLYKTELSPFLVGIEGFDDMGKIESN